MLDAWQAGLNECGAFVQCGEFEMTTDQDGATLTADAHFEDRDGTIVFEYSENMYLESVTVSGHYTTGEILQKAGLNTILGMGTVFIVLIFLCFIIWLFNFIPVLEKKFRKKEKEFPIISLQRNVFVQKKKLEFFKMIKLMSIWINYM